MSLREPQALEDTALITQAVIWLWSTQSQVAMTVVHMSFFNL